MRDPGDIDKYTFYLHRGTRIKEKGSRRKAKGKRLKVKG
jgi:hypothetical protein